MKPVLAIDLDDTLLDTASLKRDIFASARKLGLSQSAVVTAYRASAPFGVQGFIRKLRLNKTLAIKLRRDINMLLKDHARYNLPGAELALRKLGWRYNLILLTYGRANFQKKKLRQSGLAKYFFQLTVTGQKNKMRPLRGLKRLYTVAGIMDNSELVQRTARALDIKIFPIPKS